MKIIPKLNEQQKEAVYRMYGEYIMPTEIAHFIKSDWQIDYQPASVTALVHTDKARPFINKAREEYLKRVKEVPIANKRIRIEDLEYVRLKLMKLIKDNSVDSKGAKEEFRHQVKTLNEIILNAREEMEKKPFLTIGLGDFSDKSDEELIAERDEILKQAERLVKGPVIEIDSSPTGIENQSQGEPS